MILRTNEQQNLSDSAILSKGPLKFWNETFVFKGVLQRKDILYRVVLDRSGTRWLYPTNSKEPAIYIYKEVHHVKYQHNCRYILPLEDGSSIELEDLYHASPEDLFRATQVDLRGQYMQTIATGLDKKYYKLTGVILERVTYYETGLALYRPSILDIAQEQANTFNLDVFWVIQDRLSIKTGVCAPRGRYETKI